jgi:hypothetical protein
VLASGPEQLEPLVGACLLEEVGNGLSHQE